MYKGSFAQKNTYGNENTRTSRDVEYDAFSRITTMLRQAFMNKNRIAEIEAVSKNNELWTILAADLADDRNKLSDETRASLISLAMFSLRHGHGVLAQSISVEPLIDINMSIMKGLRG